MRPEILLIFLRSLSYLQRFQNKRACLQAGSVFFPGIYIVMGMGWSILLISCKSPSEPGPDNKDTIAWDTLALPFDGPVYSIFGDWEEKLTLSLSDRIVSTADQGKSWKTDKLTEYPVYKFLAREDTLYAITNFITYYTTDKNEWQEYAPGLGDGDKLVDSILVDSNGKKYKLSNEFEGECLKPTKVLYSDDGGESWIDIFPYKYPIYTIFLDRKDKVYLGGYQMEWDAETGCFMSDLEDVALLFISE